MKIVFIRHGEPDYSEIMKRGFIGHGRDLGHLTELGKQQAREAAKDKLLDGIECIVSSPYTRALQTAAIISKQRNIDIEIALDVHEWIPDLTFALTEYEIVDQAVALCIANRGVCPLDSPIKYEELSHVFSRAKKALLKYASYEKIAVVAHGMLIRQFVTVKDLPYCGVIELEFDEDFKWRGFL